MRKVAKKAKLCSIEMGAISSEVKNKALRAIQSALLECKEQIFDANKKDLEKAESEKLEAPLLKRLKFDESKLKDVVAGIDSLIGLEDPVNKTLTITELDDDLKLYKTTCPIGVIGVIFESRPDALVQISTLCLKSGNAVLLKGGSEALETNRALASVIARASIECGFPEGWINLLESRAQVGEMLDCEGDIDLLIPRGSNEFVKYIMNHTNIPVMGHADGICHTYVDSEADLDMAVRVVVDAKTQYVSVCNATETLLVHSVVAADFLPRIYEVLKEKGVEMHGCEETARYIEVVPVSEETYKTEYLDYAISIKVVDSVDEAIAHINKYGSGHTDAIISKNAANVERFLSLVDSADVFVNCSTRFADGFRYGFGAEVGISTSKLHARGPVGLDGLLSYKYKLYGNGHIVSDYAGGEKKFTHRKVLG